MQTRTKVLGVATCCSTACPSAACPLASVHDPLTHVADCCFYRYLGAGVLNVVKNVNEIIGPALIVSAPLQLQRLCKPHLRCIRWLS